MISLPQARMPSPAAFHRTEMAFVRLVSESHRLSCGEAHHYAAMPSFPGACFVTDFECAPDRVSAAMREIDDHYRALGGRCARISAGLCSMTEELDFGLRASGFVRGDRLCHARLTGTRVADSSADQASNPCRDLRILAARAMPRAYRRVLNEQFAPMSEPMREVELAIALDRLDDAQFEPWVAMRGEDAVGAAALHSVGDIGAIHGVFVSPESRRGGVGTLLIDRILQTARRWNLETVYFGVSGADAMCPQFPQNRGFEKIGVIAGWRRD